MTWCAWLLPVATKCSNFDLASFLPCAGTQRQVSWAQASFTALLQIRCRQGCLLLTDTAPQGSIGLAAE